MSDEKRASKLLKLEILTKQCEETRHEIFNISTTMNFVSSALSSELKGTLARVHLQFDGDNLIISSRGQTTRISELNEVINLNNVKEKVLRYRDLTVKRKALENELGITVHARVLT